MLNTLQAELLGDGLADLRVQKFKAFRDSLSEEDRRGLDKKLLRWADTIKAAIPHDQGLPLTFGPQAAAELFMSLIEYREIWALPADVALKR